MKFTIRDLFLVTVIVALAVGWWVDRSKLVEKIHELEPKTYLEVMSRYEYSGLDAFAPNYSPPPKSAKGIRERKRGGAETTSERLP